MGNIIAWLKEYAEVIGLVLTIGGFLYSLYRKYRALMKMYRLKKKELERMESEMLKFGNTKKEIEHLQEALSNSEAQRQDVQSQLESQQQEVKQIRAELGRAESQHQEDSRRIEALQSQLEESQTELRRKSEALRQNAKTVARSSQSKAFDELFDKFNVEDFEQYSKRLVATRKAMRCDEGVKVRARRWTLGILKDTGIHAVDMLVWSAQFELVMRTTSDGLDNFTPTALSAFKDVVTETLMAVGVYLVKQGKLTRNKLADAFNCGITKLREVVNAALPTGSDYEIFSCNREAFNRTTEIINKLESQGITSLESQLEALQQ